MPYVFNPFTGNFDQTGSGGGSQVQTDWNATSGIASILNKPTLSSVATSGSASDLGTGTLPLARLNSLVSLDNVDNAFSAGQSITAAANTSALTASYSVTGANTTPLLNLSGTWNTTGAAKGILLNITDTASASTSALLDLQVGGTSRFSILKSGQFSTVSDFYSASVALISGVRATSASSIGFSPGSNPAVAADVALYRDAANTLAQRSGTSAQLFRIYNTFSDSANYERGFMRWNSNVLEIGTEAAGTGSNRDVSVYAPINLKLVSAASGTVAISVAGSNRFLCNNGENNSYQTLRLNYSLAPATSTSSGSSGAIAWDANYIYVCTATNTWKRAALATW